MAYDFLPERAPARNRRRVARRFAAVAGIAALVTTGVSAAAIPDGDGVINGCRDERTGALSVIDEGQTCRRGTAPIAWNQRGPQGPAGAGVSGITTRSVSADFDANNYLQLFAYCSPGEIVVAGGFSTSGANVLVTTNTAAFGAWMVSAVRTDPTVQGFLRATVQCAAISTPAP